MLPNLNYYRLIMSAADELCGFGFERYWVNQALELTNHNKDYALEWLLSDEFKLARQQFNEQKRKFKAKQTDPGLRMSPEPAPNGGNGFIAHHKDPSLQGMPAKGDELQSKPPPSSSLSEESPELEMEYDLNAPDLRPKHTLRDANVIGIDHLLGSDSSDDDAADHSADSKRKQSANDKVPVAASNNLLDPNALNAQINALDRRSSAYIEPDDDEDVPENDHEMQAFLHKLKCQVHL